MNFARVIIFVGLLVLNCSAQTGSDEKTWTRIEADDSGVSVSMPPVFYVDSEKTRNKSKKIVVLARIGGAEVRFSAGERVSDYDWKQIREQAGGKSSEFRIGSVEGLSESRNAGSDGLNETIYLRTEGRFYKIAVNAPSVKDPDIIRFLRSIRIDGKALFASPVISEPNETSRKLEDLEPSPEIVEARNRKRTKQKREVKYFGFDDYVKEDIKDEFTEPPIIVEQPGLGFYARRFAQRNQTITLRGVVKAVLLANGQIGDLTVYSDRRLDFGRFCADLALDVKFVPAERNGIKVDAVVVLDYTIVITDQQF